MNWTWLLLLGLVDLDNGQICVELDNLRIGGRTKDDATYQGASSAAASPLFLGRPPIVCRDTVSTGP